MQQTLKIAHISQFGPYTITQLKKIAIPRLELITIVIYVRCLQYVKQQLKVTVDSSYLYTASHCVLKLINLDKNLSVFVNNNRVQEIKKDSEIVFGYASSKEQHPANVTTRGTDVEKLADN